ncbi:MAG: 2-hydroxyacyl-CoA dehydratase [Acetatifactor sp.]|nr:2-hydroxyacyl-CoA dehydratase [Acetatifactor sp.]
MKEYPTATFTRQMKKTHTILLPQMLEYQSPFLKAAFEGSGYHFEIMQGSRQLRQKALRYINNDFCYPGILILGQVLDEIESGRYPLDRIAFMEPQTGGACRAGNYYYTIIRTLEKCGQPQIPVISLNYKGQEKHPGFRITLPLLLSAVTAVCYGDLIMSLCQQVRPYECEQGETERVKERLEKELMEQIRCHRNLAGPGRRKMYRYILDAFDRIPVRSVKKQKVGITGEIYMKFCSLGNHGLEHFLEERGCECVMGGFVNYAIYCMDSERRSHVVNCGGKLLLKGYDLLVSCLEHVQEELYGEVEKHGRFTIDHSFAELKKRAENTVGVDCITGDGWLVAAEAASAIDRGCRNVLITHPFGCLVSHVSERGILKVLRKHYPGVNIQTIEYDYDSSDTLLESRILMGLGAAIS